MKTKLIKLEDKFILVSDEEPKIGDWYNSNLGINKLGSTTRNVEQYRQKLIADNDVSELPSIDFSLLSEEDCKTIGWVDVEKLALKYAKTYIEDDGTTEVDFKEGFKAAQALNDKMFSLEDMRKLMHESIKFSEENQHLSIGEHAIKHYDWWNNKIQSLQQTSWDCEIEIEEHCRPMPNIHAKFYVPKITNNSIKVIKII